MMLIDLIDKCSIIINDKNFTKYTVIDNKNIREIVIRSIKEPVEISEDLFRDMMGLRCLSLKGIVIKNYDFLSKFKHLNTLILDHVEMVKLPNSISNLTRLTSLYINHTSLKDIDIEWDKLCNLTTLDLDDNQIETIPTSFCWHEKLEYVSLMSNQFTHLEINKLSTKSGLKRLMLSDNNIEQFDESFCQFENLENLHLTRTKIVTIPDFVFRFKKLHYLHLSDNQLIEFNIGEDANLSVMYLNISGCGLNHIPKWIAKLESLMDLMIEDNKIEVLPDWLGQLRSLMMIHLNGNPIQEAALKEFNEKNKHVVAFK